MNKVVKFSIGILLSLIGLIYAFRSFNWNEFINTLFTVNYWYIFAAVAIQLIAVWFRAIRWKWLLAPIEEIGTKPLFDATMIGYFGNNVLPFRMGEILRAYIVSNKSAISTSKVIGTLIVERMLDLLAVMFLAIFFLFFSDLIDIPKWLIIFSIVVFFGLFIFIIGIGGKNLDWENIKQRKAIYNSKWGSKIFDFTANMISGLSVLNKTPNKVGVYGFIIILWTLYYLSYILVIKGVGIDLNIINTGVLFVLLTLSISIPAAPGYIGTYHAVAVAVLTNVYDVSINASQTFAILSHASAFVPFVIIGAIIFMRYSLNLSKIKRLEIIEK